MNVEVIKEDIKRIGHTTYSEDGNTAIICFGEEYKILSETDYGEDDILIITNLPFETYMAL